MIKFRQLGDSGLYLSVVSIGSWQTYGTTVGAQLSYECLSTALETGINFIDTADVYNQGDAERLLGDFLAQNLIRQEVIIATKVFGPMGNHWMTQGLSLRHIHNACDASLGRLQTDYIDLYQCHRFDIDTPLEETCFAMNQLINQGKIRYWGVSQWSAIQILRAINICEKNHWRKPVSNQPIYNLLNRSLEVDVMGVCEEEKVGLVVYSPLAQGLLSGKYKLGYIPENSRANDPISGKLFPHKRMTPETFAQLDALEKIAQELNIQISQLALAWCLRKQAVTSVIFGASNPKQVRENAAAAQIELDTTTLEKIETALNNHPKDQYTDVKVGHGIIKRGY